MDLLVYGSALARPDPQDLNAFYCGDRDDAARELRAWACDFLGPDAAELPLDLREGRAGEPFAVPCVPGEDAPYLRLAGERPVVRVESRSLAAWLRSPDDAAAVLAGLRTGSPAGSRVWAVRLASGSFQDVPDGLDALRRALRRSPRLPELHRLDRELVEFLVALAEHGDRHLPPPLRVAGPCGEPPTLAFGAVGERRTVGRTGSCVDWTLPAFTRRLRGEGALPQEPPGGVTLATIETWMAHGWIPPRASQAPPELPPAWFEDVCRALGLRFERAWLTPDDFAGSWRRLCAANPDAAPTLHFLAERARLAYWRAGTPQLQAETDWFWSSREPRSGTNLRALFTLYGWPEDLDAAVAAYQTRWAELARTPVAPRDTPFLLAEFGLPPEVLGLDDEENELRLILAVQQDGRSFELARTTIAPDFSAADLGRRWGPTYGDQHYQVELQVLRRTMPGIRRRLGPRLVPASPDAYAVQPWASLQVRDLPDALARHVRWRAKHAGSFILANELPG